jgi:hypothetical protein
MIDKLKLLIIFSLYKIKLNEPRPWHGKFRWVFKAYSRKWVILLLFIIFSPLLILFYGLTGIPPMWKNMTETQSYSTYYFDLDEGEKPTKWQCYKKF